MFLVSIGTMLAWSAPADAAFPGQPARVRFMRIDSDYELFVMRPNGTAIRRVTTNSVHDADARVSPNGSRLVFWRQPAGETDGEIYTMWSDGTHVRRLTNNDDEDQTPNWSPDGERIVFRSDRMDFQIDLYRMNADGSRRRPHHVHQHAGIAPDVVAGRRMDRVHAGTARRRHGSGPDPTERHRLPAADEQRGDRRLHRGLVAGRGRARGVVGRGRRLRDLHPVERQAAASIG